MIHAYSWRTPNGHKLHIMLEECALAYTLHPVDIGRGEQFAPEFLKISPNNKIPAIVDEEGPGGKPISLFESGAILIYFAEKTGQFLPRPDLDPGGRYAVLQWLMFQMAHIGPMLGQAHHFRLHAAEKHAYPIERYTREAGRLYRVLEKRLGESAYLAGPDLTIADFATFPWLRHPGRHGQSIDDFPNVWRWFDRIAERPAVRRALTALGEPRDERPLSPEEREVLYGSVQYAPH